MWRYGFLWCEHEKDTQQSTDTMTNSGLLIFIQYSFAFIFIECPSGVGVCAEDSHKIYHSNVFLRAWDGPLWVIEGGESERIQLIVWKLRAYFKWNLFDRITVALGRDMWGWEVVTTSWQLTSQHHDCDGVQLLSVRVGRHVTKANRNQTREAKIQRRTVARLKQQLRS